VLLGNSARRGSEAPNSQPGVLSVKNPPQDKGQLDAPSILDLLRDSLEEG
jgi:hypothetical protein